MTDYHIVMDEWVLHRLLETDLDKKSKWKISVSASKTIKNLIYDEGLFVVMDETGEVLGKYSSIIDKSAILKVNFSNKMKKAKYESNKNLSREFMKLVKNKAFLVRYPINLSDEIIVSLMGLPISVNNEDYIWFDLAMSSKDHIVISEDSDFTDNKNEISEQFEIVVYSLSEFVNRFCSN